MKTYRQNDLHHDFKKKFEAYKHVFGPLFDSAIVEVYPPKETIVRFDKPIAHLRFLVEGRAKITLVHENGNQSIVQFVHPGEYIGELTFLNIEKEHKNVTALSACTFLSIPIELANETLKTDAIFLFQLCQFIGDKLLNRSYFNAKNLNYELRNRLAAYILATHDHGIYAEKHTETAEYLCVSYRHLLYTFKEFTEKGFVVKTNKGYKIDQEALSLLARDIRFT
jgi:CRP-like cAMP-binding protein